MIICIVYRSYFKFLPIFQNSALIAEFISFKRQTDVHVKRFVLESYIFWLYFKYLLNLVKYQNKIKLNFFTFKNKWRFKLIIISKTSNEITLVKSPMAQKTWSKEQVGYKYFNIKIYIYCETLKYILGDGLLLTNTYHLYFLTYYIIKLFDKTTTPVMFLFYTIVSIHLDYKPKLYI